MRAAGAAGGRRDRRISLVRRKPDERQQQVCVSSQEYVQSAQPVGSNSIAANYQLGVSSATIRNDLALLEREGLLTHPHTSAGRVPTELGYRYYVQFLMADEELPSDERREIRVQFGEVRQEMDQWLRLSTSVLARTTQAAALATAPRTHISRYKHLNWWRSTAARCCLSWSCRKAR